MAGLDKQFEVPFNRADYCTERIIEPSSTVYPTEAEISVNRPTEQIQTHPQGQYPHPIYLGNKGTPWKSKGRR